MQARKVLREKIVPNTIYEAVNETLREFFIGTTDLPLKALRARHKDDPPMGISHWKSHNQEILYRDIVHEIPKSNIRSFIEKYARIIEPISESGWKTIIG